MKRWQDRWSSVSVNCAILATASALFFLMLASLLQQFRKFYAEMQVEDFLPWSTRVLVSMPQYVWLSIGSFISLGFLYMGYRWRHKKLSRIANSAINCGTLLVCVIVIGFYIVTLFVPLIVDMEPIQ